MSSPTVIRHATTENMTAIVVSYYERHFGQTTFTVAFQVYETGLKNDATIMIKNSIWSTEVTAIEQYDDWIKEHIG